MSMGGAAPGLCAGRGGGRDQQVQGLHMRAVLAAMPADRISRCAILLAGVLCGVLMLFVAAPLALSSPYPTPREREWVRSVVQASAVSVVIETPTVIEHEAHASLWEFVSLPLHDRAAAFVQAQRAATQTNIVIAAPQARRAGPTEEVDRYLWEVYQRAPVKRDSSGDFTWKDPTAAKRFGLSLPAYVIGGMDPDFREQLYHAGRAMDAAGIRWSMLSAFRDDYRQRIASGLKAGASNSLHGGKARTGGYGHGQAVDMTGLDGNERAVWRWIDVHGAKYGLYRPLPG